MSAIVWLNFAHGDHVLQRTASVLTGDSKLPGSWWRDLDCVPYSPYSQFMKPASRQISKGAEEARQQLPAILADAIAGRTTIITRHGRAVAAVVPAADATLAKPASLQSLAGTGRGLWGSDSRKVVAKLRDEWNR
jgi:antitoxin (DNA-binding transcriptional repressor) of toxin-antitoxin stability system